MRMGVLVVALLAVAGCGTPAEPVGEELAARARQAGVDVDLVYVTEGFDLAAGGFGPYGDSGVQVIYTSGTSDLRLTTSRGSLDDVTCARLPVPAATGPVRCRADGDGWVRSSGDRQEYAIVRDGVLVRVSGTGPAEVMRSAARAARKATPAELDDLLPPPSAPVTRGDLPRNGDGAPINPTGPGG